MSRYCGSILVGIFCFEFVGVLGYVERYLNPTIQYFWQAKIISKKVGNVKILTVVVLWLAFFGSDGSSQNC